jgi:sigma-B regulation protein RsbU (phosphoserine phosphatase)
MPDWAGFDVAGAAYPAELAGGDWFDFVPLSDGRTGIVVGDVSGHGVGPAILTAATNFCLRTLAVTSSDPAAMFSTANGLLPVERAEGNFVTVMLAAVEPATAILEFAGAGDCAFVLGRDGRPRCRLDSTGAPLGLNKDENYAPTQQVSLEAGDIVLLLTDGFHETLSPNKELFGYERLFAIVHQHRDESAADILQALNAAATEFAGPVGQRDDRTGVVVKCMENSRRCRVD